MILSLGGSFLVWGRVYYYAAIITALSTAFFASPAKSYLVKSLNKRAGITHKELKKSHSHETLASTEPVLGLPSNPQQDIEEVLQEFKAELEARQRRGFELRETKSIPGDKAM